MKQLIQKIYPYYKHIRRKIHSNPELCYEEVHTSALVVEELQKLNLPIKTNVGKTGVVAVLDSGKPGKTVALRAEMDALPILEETRLPYQSAIKGKMHACGHDGHTATLLAAAYVLCSLKDKFCGKVKFIFQPAEEGGAGAKAMIEDKVLEDPKVDVIFAYHNHPGSPVGTVLTRVGCALYGNTVFTIRIQGKGGHPAQPEFVLNPIAIGAKVILAIQGIMDELENEEVEPSVISVTRYESGIADNVVPETAKITGTIRAALEQKCQYVKKLLQQRTNEIQENTTGSISIAFTDIYSPTVNTPLETEHVLDQARLLFGDEKVLVKPRPARASEDFSFYLQKVPGCYFFIGNGEESAGCHNAKYDFNDELILLGSELMVQLTLRYLFWHQKNTEHCLNSLGS